MSESFWWSKTSFSVRINCKSMFNKPLTLSLFQQESGVLFNLSFVSRFDLPISVRRYCSLTPISSSLGLGHTFVMHIFTQYVCWSVCVVLEKNVVQKVSIFLHHQINIKLLAFEAIIIAILRFQVYRSKPCVCLL